jgi:hypothetical protein
VDRGSATANQQPILAEIRKTLESSGEGPVSGAGSLSRAHVKSLETAN